MNKTPNLDRIWEELPVHHVSPPAVLRRGQAARSRRRMTSGAVAGAAAILVAVGLSVGAQMLNFGTGGERQPADSPRRDSSLPPVGDQMEPIEVHPAVARAGDNVNLSFPSAPMRGVAFTLERWAERDWQGAYLLTSDGNYLGFDPAWWVVGDDRAEWHDIAVTGTGPDVVVLPEPAQPGFYRVCTHSHINRACGIVEVRA